ncbi:MAG: hypothetical protein GX423_10775 [Nitrospiraceae bacterium]|nr:hypothetical protein [Nitrospiraceae bacterium]
MNTSHSSSHRSAISGRRIPCERVVRRLFEQNRELIRREASEVKGLMALLMKHRNSGILWTPEEKAELRFHLREIARVVPVLLIFLLPFGSVFLPVLAVVVDRRAKTRSLQSSPQEISGA